MCLATTTVLAVGIGDKSEELKELSVRLLVMKKGCDAIPCLRDNKIDTLVSRWDLVDIPNGKLLEDVIAAKPSMPTIAFVAREDKNQEIAARGLGVNAVISDDIDGKSFRDIVCQLLKIPATAAMETAQCHNEHIDSFHVIGV